jgi:glycosyltransferase involved in cell wall biosynthesis
MNLVPASGARIAFAIDRLSGRGGGAERVLTETANALAARGHLVDVITHERSRDEPFYPLDPGVMLTRLRPPRPTWRAPLDRLRGPLERHGHHLPGIDRLAWLSRHGGFSRRIARYLAATRPDAVAAFLPPATTALAQALPRLRAQGIDPLTLASTHNTPEHDYLNPERWGPGRHDRRLRLAALSEMDRITVLLPDYRDWHAPDLRPRIEVLPNPVRPVPPEDRAHPDAARRLLAVGRLAAVKRHDLLIDAFARIAPDFPGWSLDIHGEGPLAEDLSARVAALGMTGRIALRGQSQDMGAVYRAAAALAHPSEFEGFPLAVAEALAHGLPAVGFADCSGTNTLIVDGQTGLLIPATPQTHRAARVEGLSAALARLMSDPGLRAGLGARGPAWMEPYAPGAIHDRWEALLLAPRPA